MAPGSCTTSFDQIIRLDEKSQERSIGTAESVLPMYTERIFSFKFWQYFWVLVFVQFSVVLADQDLLSVATNQKLRMIQHVQIVATL